MSKAAQQGAGLSDFLKQKRKEAQAQKKKVQSENEKPQFATIVITSLHAHEQHEGEEAEQQRQHQIPLRSGGELDAAALTALCQQHNIDEASIHFTEKASGSIVLGGFVSGVEYAMNGTRLQRQEGRGGRGETQGNMIFGYSPLVLLHAPPTATATATATSSANSSIEPTSSVNQRILEVPARVSRAYERLCSDGGLTDAFCCSVRPRNITAKELATCHDTAHFYREFLQSGKALQCSGTTDVYCSDTTSAQSALVACGIVVDSARLVVRLNSSAVEEKEKKEERRKTSQVHHAFCLVRPPGHHACFARPSGFCLINNIAVAACVLREEHGPDFRIAILDFDVHHGEGTQSLVEDDPNCLFVSLHRYDGGQFYPHTGHLESHGKHWNCVNIPFSTKFTKQSSNAKVTTVQDGSEQKEEQQQQTRERELANTLHLLQNMHRTISDRALVLATHRLICPLLAEFQPQIVLLSAGFDASHGDPLGHMDVVRGHEAAVSLLVQSLAAQQQHAENGGGRVGVVGALEGGYNLENVADGVAQIVRGLQQQQQQHQNHQFGKEDLVLQKALRMCAVPPSWEKLRKKHAAVMIGDGNETAVADTETLQRLHEEWVHESIDAVTSLHRGNRFNFHEAQKEEKKKNE